MLVVLVVVLPSVSLVNPPQRRAVLRNVLLWVVTSGGDKNTSPVRFLRCLPDCKERENNLPLPPPPRTLPLTFHLRTGSRSQS